MEFVSAVLGLGIGFAMGYYLGMKRGVAELLRVLGRGPL